MGQTHAVRTFYTVQHSTFPLWLLSNIILFYPFIFSDGIFPGLPLGAFGCLPAWQLGGSGSLTLGIHALGVGASSLLLEPTRSIFPPHWNVFKDGPGGWTWQRCSAQKPGSNLRKGCPRASSAVPLQSGALHSALAPWTSQRGDPCCVGVAVISEQEVACLGWGIEEDLVLTLRCKE